RRLFDTFELEHDPPRFHHRDPALRIALALPHPRLGRLLSDRLVGEQPDPDPSAALYFARERDARGLDLPVGDPAGLERHQAVVAERDGVAARGHPVGATLEPLAKLDALRGEHGLDARRIGAAVEILGPLALEDPDLDADG